MANITGIVCQIITGNINGAGTDGSIFLGIGGREFKLDSDGDDFEKNSLREYILGQEPNDIELRYPQVRVKNKEWNDPRNDFQMDSVNTNKTSVYIRFEPAGATDGWNLRSIAVIVYRDSAVFNSAYTVPPGFHNLWLGQSCGKMIYLTEFPASGDNEVLEIGRKIAKEENIQENDPDPLFQPGPFIM